MAFVTKTTISGKEKLDHAEIMRRLRYGDLRKLFRDRYGPILPDDDAGREDLIELLRPISLGNEPDRKMRHAIEVWCPWMSQKETGEIIDQINQMPLSHRKPKAGPLGQRLGLIYPDRLRLRIKTIAPCDVSPEGMLYLRKQRDKERKRLKRRLAGRKSRAEYLASHTKSKERPWAVLGMSRPKYYRLGLHRETSPSAIKLSTITEQPVSPQKRLVRKKERESADRKLSVSSIQNTPQSQIPEKPVTETANELNGHSCLTTVPEMFGHSGPSMELDRELNGHTCDKAEPEQDLRGMPKDLSCYYSGAWSVTQMDLAA